MLSEKYGARWPALIGNPALTRGKELLRREGSSKKKKRKKRKKEKRKEGCRKWVKYLLSQAQT